MHASLLVRAPTRAIPGSEYTIGPKHPRGDPGQKQFDESDLTESRESEFAYFLLFFRRLRTILVTVFVITLDFFGLCEEEIEASIFLR